MALTLPYEFDTSDVWRIILKGTFGLTLLITLSLLYTLASRPWAAAAPLALCSAMLFFITRLFLRVQTGSAGTLSADRVVIQPNRLLWFALPGPVGTYTLDRFSAVRCSIFRWKRWGCRRSSSCKRLVRSAFIWEHRKK